MCSSVCLQAQKKNPAQKCIVISLVDESTVFFLHFLNIQDVLECIYDFYNQKKKMCLKTEKLV